VTNERLLTLNEAAERLNRETVRRWLNSGRLHGHKLGSDGAGWRVPASEIDRLLSEAATGGTR
jgi:excisionase family DNA binding protein